MVNRMQHDNIMASPTPEIKAVTEKVSFVLS